LSSLVRLILPEDHSLTVMARLEQTALLINIHRLSLRFAEKRELILF
jgi:hypothetical protein